MSKLSGVADTLYIPLVSRIEVSKRFPDFFYDEKSLSLETELPENSIEKGSSEYTYMASVCRYKVMDDIVSDFMKTHEICNIVNLGAGLETAYHRLKPKSAIFYEVDLPEVIETRREILPDGENEVSIAGDLFDMSWADDIDKDLPTLMIASGVFQYFDKERIKGFIADAKKTFVDAEIMFDAMSSKALGYANKFVEKTGNANAKMNFSVDDPVAFAKECGITLIDRKPFFTEARRALKKRLTLYTKIAMKMVDEGSRAGYILHYGL